MRIAFFGSSLVSAYWNGAATYYRGIVRALAGRGHRVTFYEPDAYDRQQHRDIPDPPWAEVVVYPARPRTRPSAPSTRARGADLVVKASGVGVFDALLEREVLDLRRPRHARRVLGRRRAGDARPARPRPRRSVPRRSSRTTTSCSPTAAATRWCAPTRRSGARRCVPIYNALDPTTHHPVAAGPALRRGSVASSATGCPTARRASEEFFLRAARAAPELPLPARRRGLGRQSMLPPNVRYLGHVYTRDHNAFNCTPRAVLNISRESMARYGFSPATRVFEAAGAGACIVTDAWEGIELFLEPGREVLVADGRRGSCRRSCARCRRPRRARDRAGGAARRVLAEHTYAHRAAQLEAVLEAGPPGRRATGGGRVSAIAIGP